jgi:hypothetical protein
LIGDISNCVTENEWKVLSNGQNGENIVSTASGGQSPNANGILVDRVTGHRHITPVQLILETMDSDFEQAKWLAGQGDREKSVDSIYFVSCGNNVLDMSSVSTLSHDSDIPIFPSDSDSVLCVHSVQNNINSKIVSLLKESFDRYNYGQLLEVYGDIRRLKEEMELTIETGIDDLPDNIELSIYTFDYCKARGWE